MNNVFYSILNDIIYAVVIGGFAVLVLSFFLKKKPKELLEWVKNELSLGDDEKNG